MTITMTGTATMTAVRQQRLGGVEVLDIIETERPSAPPNGVVVEVRAAGVNPIDRKIRQDGMWLSPPFTLGWDVSGVVVDVAAGEHRFAVGDEVFGMPGFPELAGGYAQFVAGPARHFAPKPDRLDHPHAATVPLAGTTAWQALVETAGIADGDRVLVHAAAGGVGHLAVQIAKARGAYVIGTASAARHDMLRGLGADELVDHTAVDFAEHVRDVDVVLDLVGGDYEDRSLRTMRPGGLLIGVTDPMADRALADKAAAAGMRGLTINVAPDHAVLERLAGLVDAGLLRPVVAGTFPLVDVARAHDLGADNRTAGKLVLLP